MQVYDRLMLELSNRQYLTEQQYKQFLHENDLDYNAEYIKAEMQKRLLFCVIDILEAVMNDLDIMTNISTEFSDIGQAYQFLEESVQNLRDKIVAITDLVEEYSNFTLMYTRGNAGVITKPIDRATLDALIREELS